ncbi:MAG: glycosyltransferase family 2 protein [Planctomycetota bacterium]|nr:glycosyltransferase family 2 protein [Planctomycetota bacterium]
MQTPTVSAVIVSWNSLRYLPRCLESLREQELPPREIILVDNGSTDGTREWVRRHHPGVRLIANDSNRGFCVANNQGIQVAAGDHVLLLNTDVVLERGFLAVLAAALETDPGLGWASGKLLSWEPDRESAEGPQVIDSAGELVFHTRRSINRGEGEIDRGQYDRREEVFGVTAAAALYRRAMLDDVRLEGEYLDSDYFAYMEDSDLSWRAQLRGWRCLYDPQAVAHHVRHHATDRSLEIRRHAHANRYLNLVKNESLVNILYALPHLVIYESFRLVKILLTEPRLLGALAKPLRLAPRLARKRRIIQGRRRVSSRTLRAWTVPESYRREFVGQLRPERAATRSPPSRVLQRTGVGGVGPEE